MTVLMCYALARQSELVLLSKFEPPTFLDAMSKFNDGWIPGPADPSLPHKHPIVKEYNLSGLKWIMSGAAHSMPRRRDLSEELNVPISQGWGMTELAPIGCVGDHFTQYGGRQVYWRRPQRSRHRSGRWRGLPPMKASCSSVGHRS